MFRSTPPAGARRAFLLALAFSPLAVLPALGHDGHDHGKAKAAEATAPAAAVKAGDLSIEAPWLRATPGGAKVGGGYLSVTNAGSAADRLVGGKFPGAGRVEVHEMALKDGIMTMRPIAGLEIPAGGTVKLAPGGYHLMLMELAAPLVADTTVAGTLVFEKAGEVPVTFTVRPIGAGGGQHQH